MPAPSQTHARERRRAICTCGHSEQSAIGADPNRSIRPSHQAVHAIRRGLTADWKRFVAARGGGEREANYSTSVGGEPEVTLWSFDKVVDCGKWKALRDAETLEVRAVKAANAASRADPKQPARVGDNAHHAIVSQPVRRREGANRQFACAKRGSQQKYGKQQSKYR